MAATVLISKKIAFGLMFVLVFCFSSTVYGLSADEVLVVANQNAAKSKGLALYYMEKRQIPKDNLVLVFMTDKETCSREDYTNKAVPPIRRFLENNSKIRAIVTIYGVPLRISSPGATPAEQEKINQIDQDIKQLETALTSGEIIDLKIKQEKSDQLANFKKKLSSLKKNLDKEASFDSELCLVKLDDYTLNMWQANPFFLGFRGKKIELEKSNVMMTSRLDGASDVVVKRIIDDTLEAETNGLKGTAYFDARWKNPEKKATQGYGLYDQSLHKTAAFFANDGRLKVVLDDQEALFQNGQCPSAALYCGWYSLARYIDAFEWQKGSVGFHMASSECVTLKNSDSQVWCKKMLDNGIAATIGPVGEPYIQGFPIPDMFFAFLSEGVLTLAESYLISLPYLSWKMVLVGDPLYRLNLKS
ncbi:MAG: TIGR03790 family protein [Pseudomonadota bacterium]